MEHLALRNALVLALSLLLPVIPSAAAGGGAGIADIAGDANGLGAVGVERDTRPASHDAADLLSARIETTYVAIPVGDDGIDYEPTGLAITFETLAAPDVLAGDSGILYRLDADLEGCRSYFQSIVDRDDGELRMFAYWDQVDGDEAVCPNPSPQHMGSSYNAAWTAVRDEAARELRLTYPFAGLTGAQAEVLRAGATLAGARAETRAFYVSAYDSATDLRADSHVLLDETAASPPFVIGSDVPPDIPCTRGCP